jgi:DNA-binding PadR family transcriptional regulator
MATFPLTPTSYLVLGCLEMMGPATPYDLKRTVSTSVGYFWSFPHSQLYSEPARLAESGLVVEDREEHGRRRRMFAITDAGRAALREWFTQPVAELPEIRDVALLRLFFGGLADPADIAGLARGQRDAHRERLLTYEGLAENAPPSHPAAALKLGLAYERAALAFWESIAAEPPRAEPHPS